MDEHGGDGTDVIVVGGGVAGLTAATFTARAGLETLVVTTGESILARNAHLENVPGFPAGVNSRLFLEMLTDQAERNGVEIRRGRVTAVEFADGEEAVRFRVRAEAGDEDVRLGARFVVAASWSDADYLDGLGVEIRDAGSKRYVETDDDGRTNVEGVYAAGRLSETYHQTVVAAGNGAEVGLTLVHDSDAAYYHDWVTPEGYFTDRGREVPPGCEEIDAEERARRETESREVMREYFADPHPEPQRTHPSLVEDELGRLDESADD
ncbi:FAD-dependent oxidoreductase [Halopelagius longus]|uniref:FAD binding domain-containing protein n=1 Tax=Halopelagius longus TaxID=1236180 RepID=A0A1H1BYZ0_9EURY|nr:FAD-dependent oxidoreductase [Halopelagius longus]RDI70982.1 FAD-binding protein [Halopelagius longus]SDQ56990.1 FAD binding domain-containing protein [Halopelagius longus]